MTVMKLKVLTCVDDHEKSGLKDLYIDVDKITAFYVPDKHPDDEHIEGEFVTISHDGGWTNVLQQKKITDFLKDKFVDQAL